MVPGTMGRMAHHRSLVTPVALGDLVTWQSGTNGYVSTWGALCAGCQPPAALA